MQVILRSHGLLKKYFGQNAHRVELPESATVSDLFKYIERRWMDRMPHFLWNGKEHRFRGPVVVIVDGKAIRRRNTPLMHNQEVDLYKASVGG